MGFVKKILKKGAMIDGRRVPPERIYPDKEKVVFVIKEAWGVYCVAVSRKAFKQRGVCPASSPVEVRLP